MLVAATHAHLGRTRNISRGGLCADLVDDVAVGSELVCELQLVFHGELKSEALQIPARVVWCTRVDDAYQVGIMFRSMPGDVSRDLTMFLRFLAGEAPMQPRSKPTVDELFG